MSADLPFVNPWAERVPSPLDLLSARTVVAAHYARTPLYPCPALSRETGCDVLVKYENHGPVRSFKARGALYRLSILSPEERARGVVTASTGNHGQGIAWAATLLGVPATIVISEDTPALKKDAVRSFGGELRIAKGDLSAAEAEARRVSAAEGRIYIEDGDDGGLMAGAATLAWEILEDLPGVDAVVIPVGGGNLIAGAALVTKLLSPGTQIVGVQSEAAPAVCLSWQQRHPVEAPCTTTAGGLATAHPGHLALRVLQDRVDDIRLVSEDRLRRAILTVLESTGQLAEGAGAAPFAALPDIAPRFRGRKVVLLLTGGNLTIDELKSLLLAG